MLLEPPLNVTLFGVVLSLNPYSNGICSWRNPPEGSMGMIFGNVLILILMEYALGGKKIVIVKYEALWVLILILMEYALGGKI